MNPNGHSPEGPELESPPRAPVGGTGVGESRKYAVQFSAHGSGWVPENPEFVYTLEQAEAIRAEWRMRADTVGGDALITQEHTL